VTPTPFDFRNPDYREVFAQRAERLQWLRDDPTGERLTNVRAFYATDEGIAHFINDWGMTFDPRLADIGLPTTIPLILFPKQWEFIEWSLGQWRKREPGAAEKSRDFGLSWLAVAMSASLCLFREGLQIGFGSRKEEYVDSTKSPKALFWKGRQFLSLLPAEFRNGWSLKDAAHMRIDFPATGSVMTGEAGDNIGRGDRASIYWTDEDAHLERPQLIEASLSQTTNCRIPHLDPQGPR
jgi:phage terminase large subunit